MLFPMITFLGQFVYRNFDQKHFLLNKFQYFRILFLPQNFLQPCAEYFFGNPFHAPALSISLLNNVVIGPHKLLEDGNTGCPKKNYLFDFI